MNLLSRGTKIYRYTIPRVFNYDEFLKEVDIDAAFKGENFRIVVISDLHMLVSGKQPLEKSFGRPKKHFFWYQEIGTEIFDFSNFDFEKYINFVLQMARRLKPDLIILLGDITDRGDENEWDRLMFFLEPLVIFDQFHMPPILGVMGNHDASIGNVNISETGVPAPILSKTFLSQLYWKKEELLDKRRKSYKKIKYINAISIDKLKKNSWHIKTDITESCISIYIHSKGLKLHKFGVVILDSNQHLPSGILSNAIGLFGDEQAKWLEGVLEKNSCEHLIILSHHHIGFSKYQYQGYPFWKRSFEDRLRSRYLSAKDSKKIFKIIRETDASTYYSFIAGHRHFQYQGQGRRNEYFYGLNSLLFGDEVGRHPPNFFCLECAGNAPPKAFWLMISKNL